MTWTDTRLLYWGSLAALVWGSVGFSALLGAVSGSALAFGLAVSSLWATGLLLLHSARGLTAVGLQDEEIEAQAQSGRRRKELQREYHLLKRALKELELDRAMGKLSETDYANQRSLYRERAVRVLEKLETKQSYLDQLEHDLAQRRAQMPSNKPTPENGACRACQTHNDSDARFCKHCGGRLLDAQKR